MTSYQFRQRIEQQGKLLACQSIDASIKTEAQADAYIFQYVMRLLNSNNYTAAAIVLWGDRVFNPRPVSVKKIWRAIDGHSLVLLQGAGGVGKTLTPVSWLLLDWIRDPQYTNTKFISATKKHASSNAYSDLVRMHREAIVKLPGEISSDYIGLDDKEKKAGIQIIAIPPGDDGKGRLQGFHPHPRRNIHPTLGDSSRVRIYMDECITVPRGVWQGVDNVKVSLSGNDTIKIIGSYNPHDQTSITAKNAEPEDGWGAFDVERGVRGKNEWMSKEKWFVCRIDGAETENVKGRKLIFPGLITWEGYRNLQAKEGGNSIDYYVFGRGAFPPEGAVGVIISPKLLEDCRGEFQFSGLPIHAAGVDVAVDGRDNCVLTVGRVGNAWGFQPRKGKMIRFKEARRVLQVDQQFALKKGSTKIVGDEIVATCRMLGVSSEYLCVDASGNGSAVYSYLKIDSVFGDDVQGVNFSAKATQRKILEEDQYTPEDLYDGIVSEAWFAMARWMEFGHMAISPSIRRDPLENELTARKFIIGAGKKQRVQKKDDYKLDHGASPDYADSLSLLLFAVRMREGAMGSMVEDKPPEPTFRAPRHDSHTSVDWLQDSGV